MKRLLIGIVVSLMLTTSVLATRPVAAVFLNSVGNSGTLNDNVGNSGTLSVNSLEAGHALLTWVNDHIGNSGTLVVILDEANIGTFHPEFTQLAQNFFTSLRQQYTLGGLEGTVMPIVAVLSQDNIGNSGTLFSGSVGNSGTLSRQISWTRNVVLRAINGNRLTDNQLRDYLLATAGEW